MFPKGGLEVTVKVTGSLTSPSGLGLPLPIQIFCGLSDDRNFTSNRKVSKEEDSRESLMLPASYELNSN